MNALTDEQAWRVGQRVVLGAVGGVGLLAFGCFLATPWLGGYDGPAAVLGFLLVLAIVPFGPYVQWLVVLPLVGALHVNGRTMLARGVLRAAFLLFVISGVMYGFCGGVVGLFGALDGY